MDNSKKLNKLLEWNNIKYTIENVEGDLNVLKLFCDDMSIHESRPFNFDNPNEEEIYDLIIYRFQMEGIEIFTPGEYIYLKCYIFKYRFMMIIPIFLYFFSLYNINFLNGIISYASIPLAIFSCSISFLSFKNLRGSKKTLSCWKSGETLKKGIEKYKRQIRMNQFR